MRRQLTQYGITEGPGPGLTFLEALKTGVPFKRPGDDSYFRVIEKDGMRWIAYGDNRQIESMSVEYIEATDYELKPAEPLKKILSDVEILEAIRDTAKEVISKNRKISPNLEEDVMNLILTNSHIILRKLGLRFE
jgi:hypothetical protein